MLDKIDITQIVKGHFSTFRDYGTGKVSYSDYILFIAAPLALSLLGIWKGFAFGAMAVNGLLTAFSIFAGLLFNLLLMVLSFLQSTQGSATDRTLIIRKNLLREITSNLSFAILVSVLIVIIAVVSLSMLEDDKRPIPLGATFILLFGALNFALTLFMLLKRMYALMQNEFDRHKTNRAA
jgi:hypothetical protein